MTAGFRAPLAVAAILLVEPAAVRAQAIAEPPPSVRHRIEVSFTLDRDAPAIKENRNIPRTDLKMQVRVADHAIDSDFLGTVTASFVSADPVSEGMVYRVWQDASCHIDRGLPKFSIIDITGTIKGEDRTFEVAAMPRRIGKQVPEDEIVAQRMAANPRRPRVVGEELGIFLHAQTKRSGIHVNIDLIAMRCKP